MGAGYKIYNQDCLEFMKKLDDESFDMIFADPPYMISNVGTSCQNGKLVSINKGKWDYCQGVEANFEFHKSWLKKLAKRMPKTAETKRHNLGVGDVSQYSSLRLCHAAAGVAYPK